MSAARFPLVAALALAGLARAGDDHWPHWRGPEGTGVARGDAPLRWSATENVKWAAEIPERGFSTPICWGERIFLTTAVPTGREAEPAEGEGEGGGELPPEFHGGGGRPGEQALVVLCLARDSGELLWERAVKKATPHEGYHGQYGSYASASPVTDGQHLFVSFGSFGVYCLTLDGEPVWDKDFGVRMRMRRQFGEGAAPVLYGDVLVQIFDHEEDSFVVAVDKRDGKELWRVARDEPSTWATPLPLEVDGVAQVIASGTNRVRSYALESGELIWECGGLGLNAIPNPVRHGELVIAMSGYRDPNLLAIRLGGEGDLTESDAVRWSTPKGTSYTPSPVLHEGLLYCVTDRGFISCFDAETGEAHYLEERLPRGSTLKASPVAAGPALYVPVESGDVHVIRLGSEYEVLATNSLPDQFFIASPMVVEGELFLRSATHLFCIAAGDEER